MSNTTHDLTRRQGVLSPPKKLAAQIELLLRVIDGMQKHAKDADYPTQLETLGVEAAHDHAVIIASDKIAAKALVRNKTGMAAAEQAQLLVFLEKVQNILQAAYGKRNTVLYDYGFRIPTPPKSRARKSAHATAKPGKKGAAATRAGATATEPAGGSPGTPSTPSATPPSTTPKS